MTKVMKALIAILFLASLGCAAHAQTSSSVTADLANKCRQAAIKAHPTPKAGTKASGAEKAQRDYFQACIAKGSSNK